MEEAPAFRHKTGTNPTAHPNNRELLYLKTLPKLFHFGVQGEAELEMKDGPFAAERQGLAANRLALRRSRVVVVNSEFKRRGLTTSGAIHEGERK